MFVGSHGRKQRYIPVPIAFPLSDPRELIVAFDPTPKYFGPPNSIEHRACLFTFQVFPHHLIRCLRIGRRRKGLFPERKRPSPRH